MALHTGEDGVNVLQWCRQQGCLTLISRLTFHGSLSLRTVLSYGLSAHFGPERLQNVARHVQARLNTACWQPTRRPGCPDNTHLKSRLVKILDLFEFMVTG
jgi:hypothetical protein